MHDIADWTAASVSLETMEIEVVFLLEPTFYTGDPNDSAQLQDPRHQVALPIPSFPRVVVGARVSKSGVANAQSGDLETLSQPFTTLEQKSPLKLVIDSVVP